MTWLNRIEPFLSKQQEIKMGSRVGWVEERNPTLTDIEAEIEAFWVEEAERRLDELEQGGVNEIPVEEALRRARAVIS
jgi:hypothetical protein